MFRESFGEICTSQPNAQTSTQSFRTKILQLLSYLVAMRCEVSRSQTTITVASSAGFPATPFNALLVSTFEVITVNSVSGATWNVTRGQAGTTAAAAAAGATVSS
jgi:hypothetical protein